MEHKLYEKNIIITNNPRVKKEYEASPLLKNKFSLTFIESRSEVFLQVRNLIHNNWKVLNHAMAGNIPLHKHPYRSMGLQKNSNLDTESLILWESATERVNRGKCPPYPDDVLEDFQELDYLLFSDSINRI